MENVNILKEKAIMFVPSIYKPQKNKINKERNQNFRKPVKVRVLICNILHFFAGD